MAIGSRAGLAVLAAAMLGVGGACAYDEAIEQTGAGGAAVAADAYDPLAPAAAPATSFQDITAFDPRRQRVLPLRIYTPTGTGPAPVVLFSHGLGGSREGSAFLGEHWSRAGYVVVYIQHPGSDEAVWRDVPARQRMAAMKAAASGTNLVARLGDVGAVLDQLMHWNEQDGHWLQGRLDLGRVGMSGHSFGARTTQGVSGQSLPLWERSFADPRIDAALPMSPSSGAGGGSADEQFAGVDRPWMLMTGTDDLVAIGGETMETRYAVFDALPPGAKYELVLDGGEHHAFTDGPERRGQNPRDPNDHRVILALSTAFWDAHVKGDPSARAWLDGDGPRQVLQPADSWERK